VCGGTVAHAVST